MKNIYLLGATGSIGKQTLEVLRTLNGLYRLVSICFGSKLDEAIKIIEEFKPKLVCTNNEFNYKFLKNKYIICTKTKKIAPAKITLSNLSITPPCPGKINP